MYHTVALILPFPDSLVLPDHLYKVQGWTRLLNGKSKEDNSSIELWLRWKVAGVENEEKKLLGLRNKFLKSKIIYFCFFAWFT